MLYAQPDTHGGRSRVTKGGLLIEGLLFRMKTSRRSGAGFLPPKKLRPAKDRITACQTSPHNRPSPFIDMYQYILLKDEGMMTCVGSHGYSPS